MQNRSMGAALACAFLAFSSPAAAQEELVKLTASQPILLGGLGGAVALGDGVALVGAPSEDQGRGAVYVFEELAGAWSQTARIEASDVTPGGQFGIDLALDGDRALVGSNDDKVYVLEPVGGAWQETEIIHPVSATWADSFGLGVALDGDRALIGAAFDDTTGMNAGAAYVFERQAGGWVEVQKLTASVGQAGDRFGEGLALEDDRLVVGAFGADDFGPASGAAYVFEQQAGTWIETARLVASDASAEASFGQRVALAGDHLIVTANSSDGGSGSAYAFAHGVGGWTETARLAPPDQGTGDHYGFAVDLEGTRAILGSWQQDGLGDDAGAAYLYELRGDAWTQKARLASFSTSAGDHFGYGVALSGDLAVVGAPAEDGAVPGMGAAVLFDATTVSFLGCGVNPGGSLSHAYGTPAIGASWRLGVDNPLGTQAPGALAFLALSTSPDPATPCGAPLPGFGMTSPGGAGELLVALGGPLVVTGPALWAGPGDPADVPLAFPNEPALVGVAVFVQGVLADGAPGASIPLALTEGMSTTILP